MECKKELAGQREFLSSLVNEGRNPRVIRRSEQHLNKLADFLQGRELTGESVLAWCVSFGEADFSVTTMKDHFSTVNRFLRYLGKEDLLLLEHRNYEFDPAGKPRLLEHPEGDLTGMRFGRLTVTSENREEPGKSRWNCRCDCGGECVATTGHLRAGNVTSCGCLGREKQKDLTGMRFGRLTVRRRTELRYGGSVLWECECDCGETCLKPTGQLNDGTARSCGCAWRQPAVKAGDRFGRLTAIRATEERQAKSVVWECRCDCGETTYVRASLLKSGHTTSCGCIKREIDAVRDPREILTYTDDTCIEFARNIAKPRSSTSPDTGVRGVILTKDGRYHARLTFRKVHYDLGKHKTLEAAIRARRQAEDMVEEYLEEYDDLRGTQRR